MKIENKKNEKIRQMISETITFLMVFTAFLTMNLGTPTVSAGAVGMYVIPNHVNAPDGSIIPHYFGPYPNYANSPLPSGAVTNIVVEDGGTGYSISPTVNIYDKYGLGDGTATASATVMGGVITDITVISGGSGYVVPKVEITDATGTGAIATATIGGVLTGGIRKFVDSLAGLGPTNANNLGQYIPVAVADTTTFPGCDYYEIAVVQYTEKMHSDLPPTLLQGYVQLETPVNYDVSLHIALWNPDGTQILKADGTQAIAVDNPHYMGPTIVAKRDIPVRIKFSNLQPTGISGDLFLPVDTTVMGSGTGPHMIMPMDIMYMSGMKTITINTMDPHNLKVGSLIQIENFVPAEYSGRYRVESVISDTSYTITLNMDPGSTPTVLGHIMECYTDNRATVHLHGGYVPWISDGTPHQWTTPAGENTSYPKGVSVQYVPDMWFVNGTVVPNTIGVTTPPVAGATNDPGDGSITFYYNNQQSARLQFYHDHSYGITRLNVYAGEAAPYLITDEVEEDMILGTDDTGVNPNHLQVLPDIGIPLVIQDKTFVDANTIGFQDPTWIWGSSPGTPRTGDLWLPHVYMPNQNPWDPSGMATDPLGRWHYGPWFWPPTMNIEHPPVANPYYDPINSPKEPPLIPGVPSNSMAMEAFMDTPTVNGVGYPYLEVEPKAYRFRILSVGNDRHFNLQLYVADPNVITSDGRYNTEVAMVPASVCNPDLPPDWPTDGRDYGVPDPEYIGPSFIQIANEGGWLPAPTVIPNHPITWNLDPTTFNFGNVDQHSLLLGPAERADVIVDFSAYAGQTLILYNDAPAAFPARDARYDYFTNSFDLTDDGGTPTTQPGYGPNIRTIMQIRVNNTTPAPTYNVADLEAVFAKTTTKRGVFEVSQDPIIIPQTAYSSAYNQVFTEDNYARIFDTSSTFQTISGNTLTIPFQPKAVQDEQGEAFETEYGRMSAMLGLELPGNGGGAQNFMLYPYPSPPVDIVTDCLIHSEPTSGDGTQIWKITHNGVDTHTLHFHLFNVQYINSVAWDNQIMPPDPNELGWKETLRIDPLEDTIVALRSVAPTQPFDIPNSIRFIDPTMPEGEVLKGPPGGYMDPSGEPVTVVNHKINFGWEYVQHCHLLGHEEMDMMHPVIFGVAPKAPSNLTLTLIIGPKRVVLNWQDNSISETGFTIQRADDIGFTVGLVTFTVGADVTTYTDNTIVNNKLYYYRIQANNVIGDTAVYQAPSIGFPHMSMDSAFSNFVTFDLPVITKISLPDGTIGVAYNTTLTAAGGQLPYTWSIILGSLPNGLSLNPTSGVISGIPTTAQISTFTVMVTDNVGNTATKILQIRIIQPVTIITNNLPTGRLNRLYSTTLLANGGTTPYTWSISVGSLPHGLAIDPTTGVISGTPTSTGTFTFTAKVTDSKGGTATKALSIRINP